MYLIEIVLLAVGIALLAVGYRRNHRNLLLAGALVLFASAAVADLVDGFMTGWEDTRPALSSHDASSHN